MTTSEGVRTDLNSLKFWALPRSAHHETFRWLRENKPVSWNDAPDSLDPTLNNATGFWSVVKHAHIAELSLIHI